MIVQTFEYVCDLCDKHHREQIELAFVPAVPVLPHPALPGLPVGWRYVGHQLLCALHQVVIDPRPESV